jgi:protein phosphatase
MKIACRQIQGCRKDQQDNARCVNLEQNRLLVLLADGMGGQAGGQTASRLAIEHFIAAYPSALDDQAECLRHSLAAANASIAEHLSVNPRDKGMGTTLVAAVIDKRGVQWLSVGDSPLWLYRQGLLRRLNQDHSLAAVFVELVALGRMTAEDAAADPKRCQLRSVINGETIAKIDLAQQPHALSSGDMLLLASDGILTLSENRIATVLHEQEKNPVDAIVQTLIQQITDARNPAQDNASIMLYRHSPV